MSFLAPLFLLGLAAIAVPVFVHLIQRERKDVIEFPSLMFIRQIPYQSVERRRINNWLLLLLRVAAMALVVAAFARPFFNQDPVKAAAAASGAREVVILLDRSASMGYRDHWTKAVAEARKAIAGLGTGDRGTLVVFDRSPEEVVRGTTDHGALESALAQVTVSSGATRFAPALRLAQSLLSRSTLSRREAVLISDFQKTGWERQEDIRLPEGATITPVSVADLETADLSVASVNLQRASFSGQERVTITAGLTNRSGTPVTNQAVTLEIDGRTVDSRTVTIGPNASGSVSFDAVTVADANMRGVIRAGTDGLAKNNDFYFVLSPSRPVSVLILQSDQARANSSVYLTTVLDLGNAPPFKRDVMAASRLTSAALQNRALVVLNDAQLSSDGAALLRRFAEQGGGVLIGLGDRNPAGSDWPVLPGVLGNSVDRSAQRGGTLGYLDYSHPVFDEFKDPRNGNFVNMRFQKYRTLTPAATDKVLARFDDGASALVERRVGNGRVIAFASTLDDSWNDAPRHGMFLPLVQQLARYLAQYEEPQAWHGVGRMLDISAAVGQVVREGQAGLSNSTVTAGVVVSPAGEQTALGSQAGASSVELTEQGFYSVRLSGTGDRRPFTVAVNLDPAESDLSALPPADFLTSATGRPVAATAGQSLEKPEITRVDIEKKQSIWWYLMVAGLVALFAEAVLSNHLARRAKARQGTPAAA